MAEVLDQVCSVAGIRPADLPAPPQGAIQIVQTCSQPGIDSRVLGNIVNKDPVLTAELLRISNSAYFGLVSQVKSVTRAVTVLGNRALRNLVLCISMRDALRADSIPGFNFNNFWEDALRRAVSARVLAEVAGLDADECFTTGLLQDFGLLVMLYLQPEQVKYWDELSQADPDHRLELEADYFHTTHDDVGHLLARTWDLPNDLALAMGCHHTGFPGDALPDEQRLCQVARCADWMAAVYSSKDKRIVIQHCRVLLAEYFNLAAEQTDGLLEQVADSMEEAATALGVKAGEPLSYEAVLREANLALAEENLSYQEMTWRLERALEERDHFASNLRRELELAREVQQSLLPDTREGINGVVGINLSAREVSGDFYDFFKLPDGRISFCLADVSGKGMNAALLMAKTSSLYRCLGRSISDPAKMLAMLNREIVETSIRGMFVTMVAGIVDPATGEVTLANAGHLPPLHMGSVTVISDYPALSPPLGIGCDFNFTSSHFNLDGNSLYLYTDGLLEARLDEDNRLEHEGLVRLLKKYAHLAPAKRVSKIANAVRGPNGAIEDDLTLLLIDGNTLYGLQ